MHLDLGQWILKELSSMSDSEMCQEQPLSNTTFESQNGGLGRGQVKGDKDFALNFCYGLNWAVSSPNSYVEAPTPRMAVFGDWDSKEVIKIKYGHKGGALSP